MEASITFIPKHLVYPVHILFNLTQSYLALCQIIKYSKAHGSPNVFISPFSAILSVNARRKIGRAHKTKIAWLTLTVYRTTSAGQAVCRRVPEIVPCKIGSLIHAACVLGAGFYRAPVTGCPQI